MNRIRSLKFLLVLLLVSSGMAVLFLAWTPPGYAADTSSQAYQEIISENGSRGQVDHAPEAGFIAYVSQADFSEGFEDIAILPGQGWHFQNNSNPIGITDWFQGNETVFPAQSGDPTAYIGANYNSTAGVGTISNWMLTPEFALSNGDVISFWTSTATGSSWPDRLELRLSTSGGSTNVGTLATDVGDFTTLLLSVNPTLTVGGYPEVWTQYTVTLSGIPSGASGRFGFRYYVTNAGPSGANSNYIGIDTVEIDSANASIVFTKTVGTDPSEDCATTKEITVNAGSEVYYCYMVINNGDATLDFHTLVDSELGTILDHYPQLLEPGDGFYYKKHEIMFETTTNAATWTAMRDLYAYRGIPYALEDIRSTGTAVSLSDDSVSPAIPLGFDFNYYLSDYNEIYVSSNGFLSVLAGQGNGCCTGGILPSTSLPNGVIAGWWEDMNPSAGGTIHYQTLGTAPNRRFILQVMDVPHYGGGNFVSLEYKLFESSNTIEVHYLAAPSDGGTHSAGIENQTGTEGLQYYYGTGSLSPNTAVQYYRRADAYAEASDTATVNVLRARIGVEPEEMQVIQAINDILAHPLVLHNLGDLDLEWTIAEEPVLSLPAVIPMGNASVAQDVFDLPVQTEMEQAQAPAALSEWTAPGVVLYDNGPFVTHPGGGAGGADASALQSSLNMSTFGFGFQVSAGNRVADDFTVTGSGWAIDSITFFGYQTFSGTTSTFTSLNLRIWDGPPNDPSSLIVFGDTITNRMTGSEWTNVYRVLDTTLSNEDRPVMALVAEVNSFLPPGTYWLDWQTDGTLTSGPWVPPITILGQTTTGNALQYTSTGWAPLVDAGTVTQQGLPFIIEGMTDCSAPGDVPWLMVNPASGTVPPGTSANLDVSIDTNGLSLGTYNANLCVFSNDLEEPIKVVPVELEVVSRIYGLELSPPQVASSGSPGEMVDYYLSLTNTGNGTDTFMISISGQAWNVILPQVSFSLNPAASADVIVRVSVPFSAKDGDWDKVIVKATSSGSAGLFATAELTTTAIVEKYLLYLPAMLK